MREQGTAGQTFGSLTDRQVADQARLILDRRDELLASQPDPAVRDLLAVRLANLQKFVDGVDAGKTTSELRAEQKQAGTITLHHAVEAAMILTEEPGPGVIALAQPKVKWEPKEHPRDSRGRFRLVIGGATFDYLQKIDADPNQDFTLDPDVKAAFQHAEFDEVQTPTKGAKKWATVHVSADTANRLDEGLGMVLGGQKVTHKPAGSAHTGAKTARSRILDVVKAAHAQGGVVVPNSRRHRVAQRGRDEEEEGRRGEGRRHEGREEGRERSPPGQDPDAPKVGKLNIEGPRSRSPPRTGRRTNPTSTGRGNSASTPRAETRRRHQHRPRPRRIRPDGTPRRRRVRRGNADPPARDDPVAGRQRTERVRQPRPDHRRV